MDDIEQQQGATAHAPRGRRGRRAARRAAELAVASAGPVAAARRGRRLVRTGFRLAKAGLVVGGAAAGVWWAMQRPTRSSQQGRGGVAGPRSEGSGPGGGDVPVDARRSAPDGAPGSDRAGRGGEGDHTAGDRIVDLREAAELLQVEPARIPVMVESGLLQPVGGDDDQLRFRAAEVEAVRHQGG